jgi:hypothetical protein
MVGTSRRAFLGGISGGVASAALGAAFIPRIAWAAPVELGERLRFGALDPLVDLLQATPPDELLPAVVKRLRTGTPLSDVVAAGALANARGFGGTDYNGYHALMAMVPAWEIASQMPAALAPLPVLKVMHRNARFLQAAGRAHEDALEPLAAPADAKASGEKLVQLVRGLDMPGAERELAALDLRKDDAARASTYEALQDSVRDDSNVHRVVLAWRAWDTLRLTGNEHALSMLRQSVRFCVDEDGRRTGGANPVRELVPKIMRDFRLEERERGARKASDEEVAKLADTIFRASSEDGAKAVARELAAGLDPEDAGAAISLAATHILLHDPGRTRAETGKPLGSVHGASHGVHASDAANAWRHIARVGGSRNAFASLIAAAYHTAGKAGGDKPHDDGALPCGLDDRAALLDAIAAHVRERDQKSACQAARRYCALGHGAAPLFAQLLEFIVSEDGALHAEKYFRTAQEEHSTARAPHRDLYLVALTRVAASQQGFPAPGLAEARSLLG